MFGYVTTPPKCYFREINHAHSSREYGTSVDHCPGNMLLWVAQRLDILTGYLCDSEFVCFGQKGNLQILFMRGSKQGCGYLTVDIRKL